MKVLFRICKTLSEKCIVNEEHMTEILLFFIIVSEVIVKTQDMEKIVEKKDEMTEEEKAEDYRIESTMAEIEGLITHLNQSTFNVCFHHLRNQILKDDCIWTNCFC